jgi:hypothetical protein
MLALPSGRAESRTMILSGNDSENAMRLDLSGA